MAMDLRLRGIEGDTPFLRPHFQTATAVPQAATKALR